MTYTEAMQTQYEKVQTYLNQTETTKPVAFHELKRILMSAGRFVTHAIA